MFAGIGLDTVIALLARTSSRVRALAAIAGVALCALTSALPWRGFLPTAPLSDLHPPSRALEALRQRASSGRALDLGRILPGGVGELYGFPRLKRDDASGLRRFSEVFAAEKTELLARPGWSDLKAAQDNNIYIVNAYQLGQQAKTLTSLYVAAWLYQEAFADFNPDDLTREWVEKYLGLKHLGGDGVYFTRVGKGQS